MRLQVFSGANLIKSLLNKEFDNDRFVLTYACKLILISYASEEVGPYASNFTDKAYLLK